MEQRQIKVMQSILKSNDDDAANLRAQLTSLHITAVNLMSSPGSGKTSLLEQTAKTLGPKMAVVEGDIATTLDAARLAAAGVQTCQINTGPFGGDCHLEAGWVKGAIQQLDLTDLSWLFIENIGNLVCPAEFDVGSHANCVLVSVTEGPEKPLKYPLAFTTSQLCLITKTDLLPYLDFDLELLKANIAKVNPKMDIIELSSKTGEGVDKWLKWLQKRAE